MNNKVSTSELRTDARANPLGTSDAAPRLSWKIATDDPDRRGLRQASYRVRVATTPARLADAPDLWDSGVVASDQSVDVLYAGKPPAARQRAYWSVTVTDETGESAASETAFWEVGLLTPGDWQGAEWISGTLTGGARTS
ncbi:MAG: alpha-L-rhamnosidase, partial [Armatimonadetes bacterium]|nr:alpha-L-rhamnosidase [Armatimonadota bacterium]